LRGSPKLRVIARLTNRFVNLKVEYQASLAKVSIHVISLQKLSKFSFLIFLCADESIAKSKAKGAKF
jgi:hypothetical protein